MRRLLLAGLALAALAASPARADPSLFGTLKSTCLESSTPSAALAVADGAGWITVSPTLVPLPANPSFTLREYGVRLKQVPGGAVEFLIAGTGTAGAGATGGQIPAQVCMVGQKPADPAASAQLRAYAAVEPVASQATQGAVVYMYEDSPSGHRLPVGAALAASLKAGRAHMLLSMTPPGQNIRMLGAVQRKPGS